ncbi:MAG: hypothetical protein Q8O90_12870 [Elusimicrobiota bacterium]|nr:hypothetical protein [Elusimicrobiota bacterium]
MNDKNKSEPATKADLQELEQRLNGKTDSAEQKLNGKIDSAEQKLNGKIDSAEQKLNGKIDSVEQRLNGKIDSVEQRLNGKIDSVEQKLGLKIDSVETTVNRLAIELTKTQADVREIKHDMATKMSTKDDISRLLNHIDAFAAEALSYRNHDTLRGGKIMEHETKLENHETRLSELETNPR